MTMATMMNIKWYRETGLYIISFSHVIAVQNFSHNNNPIVGSSIWKFSDFFKHLMSTAKSQAYIV